MAPLGQGTKHIHVGEDVTSVWRSVPGSAPTVCMSACRCPIRIVYLVRARPMTCGTAKQRPKAVDFACCGARIWAAFVGFGMTATLDALRPPDCIPGVIWAHRESRKVCCDPGAVGRAQSRAAF